MFLAFLGLAMAVALVDPRRGWLLALVVGVLQDPVRKMTPGHSPMFILAIAAVYGVVVFGALAKLRDAAARFRTEYRDLYRLFIIFFWFLVLAALNGLVTFGLTNWKAPALALFVYLLPLPAILLGYLLTRNDRDITRLLTFYAAITSVALIAVPLEFWNENLPFLGTVGMAQDWIRHLPGVQVRLLSGTFRGPDIMAWHAAMLCMIGLTMIVRKGFPRGWLWMGVSSWGFLCCLMSGRRKMLYMIAVFAAVFLIRFLRRFSIAQVSALAGTALSLWLIVDQMAGGKKSAIYTRSAGTSQGEILKRLEGGLLGTFRQAGLTGLGLGAATQGTRHLVKPGTVGTWQEGGAGKLAVELGFPALIFLLFFGVIAARRMWRIAHAPRLDPPAAVLPLALLALIAANFASFLVSHQPFSDPYLVLMNAYLIGALFATQSMNEPLQRPEPVPAVAQPQLAGVAPQPLGVR
ncbi:MAG TPA: hypothetical protein VMT00_13640 [Thermoanaerobaculia bacterium]|nr:hypothetical protein [Thermoanaerobaculia bacterium]